MHTSACIHNGTYMETHIQCTLHTCLDVHVYGRNDCKVCVLDHDGARGAYRKHMLPYIWSYINRVAIINVYSAECERVLRRHVPKCGSHFSNQYYCYKNINLS